MVTRLHDVSGVAFRWVLLAVLGALLTGCASYPPAPALAASADYRYIIGPGDQVNIIVWRNPELSMTVPVRPDGMIAGPLIENGFASSVTVAGPCPRRVSIARRVGSASAAKVRLK